MLGRIARTAGAASTNLSRSFTTSGGGLSSVQHVSKFYTKAEACPYEKKDFAKTIGGRQLWTVKLDGRTLRTADKHEYFVPSELLARMITMEFYQQHEYIISATLPLVTSHPEKSSELPNPQSTSTTRRSSKTIQCFDCANSSKETRPVCAIRFRACTKYKRSD